MAKYDLVTFKCRGCDAPLEAQHYTAGQLVSCPRCTQTMTLDVQETPSRNTLQRRGSEDPGVPLKLKLGEAGGFETTVSRQDAGRMGHTFLGGLLVAVGVDLAALLGFNLPDRS